jgi:hypothetical protein
MTSFDLSNYVEVNTRIEKFWEKYPDGRIATDIVSFENGVIVIKASVYKAAGNEQPDATGHAYEKEGSSYINKTSAVENCETSAVGRALGILGFEIKKSVASREEVANAVHQQKDDNYKILKKELMKKYKGDAAKAKAEFEKIMALEKDNDLEAVEAELEKELENERV